jgi:protein phosphatase PTC1
VCSDQEAVDLIRNTQDPQEASRVLVDHALSRFSTDNLSVMIVRFDSKQLQNNTTTDIGVESETTHDKGAISEVEMLVNEARRNSSAVGETALDDSTEELKDIQEQEEDQEPGPELTPEGQEEADRLLAEKATGKAGDGESKDADTVDEKKTES